MSSPIQIQSAGVSQISVEIPSVVLTDIPFELKLSAQDEQGNVVKTFAETVRLEGIRQAATYGKSRIIPPQQFSGGTLIIANALVTAAGSANIGIESLSLHTEVQVRAIPGFLSLLPPLLAIALAFLVRQVLLSLFSGIWIGAMLMADYNPISGFMRTVDTFLPDSLADPDHASILLFSLTLGAMVGVISKAGGMQGIVEVLSRYARSPRSGQLATWAMGLLIFFDDYANTLVVGNTMRPFTDRLKISREKLSYIVDSTAAPVASIALISTWIGFQVGLIDDAIKFLDPGANAYNIFLQSIPFSTYSVLALVFVLIIAISLRDFGGMRSAEARAKRTGMLLAPGAQPITDSSVLDMVASEDTPLRWYNGFIPVLVVMCVTLTGLYFDGKNELGSLAQHAGIGTIFGAANSFRVLMWASFSGLFTAAILAIVQKCLTLQEAVEASISGYKSMLMAAMILILAWAIGDICKQLHTADYVIELSKGILSPHFIPFITFILAAFISFSTGSSWATMAILTPIVIPIAFQLPLDSTISGDLGQTILLASVGAVLSGSVLGDHCSPISDTTILSSMASAADHLDHVKTQIPYALLVGGVAIILGYIPAGWGINPYLSLIVGILILTGLVLLIGKKSEPLP
jgi:Na+/H+ antiporter NhaC